MAENLVAERKVGDSVKVEGSVLGKKETSKKSRYSFLSRLISIVLAAVLPGQCVHNSPDPEGRNHTIEYQRK
jgi:hypothetical protein